MIVNTIIKMRENKIFTLINIKKLINFLVYKAKISAIKSYFD